MTAVGARPMPDLQPEAWVRCSACGGIEFGPRYRRNLRTCSVCGHYGLLPAHERIATLADPGSVRELDLPRPDDDPLQFTDTTPYPARLAAARNRTGLDEAAVCVRARSGGAEVVLVAMDFAFMGGSLGRVVGEHVTRAVELATDERVPLVLVTSSGGARMQEGSLALMQMAKTSRAMAEADAAGVLTVAVLTDPTYGGVAASFATLPDVILAEEGARTGFAGPRVVAQTTGEALPDSFQTAESLRRGGFVDEVLTRRDIPDRVAALVRAWSAGSGLPSGDTGADGSAGGGHGSAAWLVTDADDLPERDAWDAVRAARGADRPGFLDYADMLLDGFVELHGDRLGGGDCPAMVGGVGLLDGRAVVLLGQQKGRDTAERVRRDFGMASPAGYRKAARLMRLAQKWRIPVVTLIDTPGAHPGVDAEQNGQAWAISDSLRLMSELTVPVLSIVTGEGGSGGALALGVADRCLALSGAVFSVISPEGCASILWKHTGAAPEAARALRMHAPELLRGGIVDAVLPEPGAGAHDRPSQTAQRMREALADAVNELARLPVDELLTQRRNRFRSF